MAKVKNFQLFRNFTKISIYTKNDEMNMFGKFQLKITTGSAKTLTPIFCEIPKKGFTKMTNFSFSLNFSQRNVYLMESASVEDAKCENDVTNAKIQSVTGFKKWLQNGQKFLTLDPRFFKNQSP